MNIQKFYETLYSISRARPLIIIIIILYRVGGEAGAAEVEAAERGAGQDLAPRGHGQAAVHSFIDYNSISSSTICPIVHRL